MQTIRIAGLSSLVISLFVSSSQGTEPPVPRDVRVMSFNIRYGTANDGENHWDLRKEFLVSTVTAFDPDLLGTQETLAFQRDYLAEKLSAYEVLGVGRNDGREDGEMMALYYRKERFRKLDGGHFWLSKTPSTIGSKSWDSALPRMVTWVKLSDLHNETAPPVCFFNTHFDHQGTIARLESARLLRRQIETIGKECAIVLTGDFNTAEVSDAYRALFDPVDAHTSSVVDTYRVAHPSQNSMEGTFSGFRSDATDGSRIDWIAASRDWTVVDAAIDRTAHDGRTPSDHFPVTARLKPEMPVAHDAVKGLRKVLSGVNCIGSVPDDSGQQ